MRSLQQQRQAPWTVFHQLLLLIYWPQKDGSLGSLSQDLNREPPAWSWVNTQNRLSSVISDNMATLVINNEGCNKTLYSNSMNHLQNGAILVGDTGNPYRLFLVKLTVEKRNAHGICPMLVLAWYYYLLLFIYWMLTDKLQKYKWSKQDIQWQADSWHKNWYGSTTIICHKWTV